MIYITLGVITLFYIFILLLTFQCKINFINEIKDKIKYSRETKFVIEITTIVLWIFQIAIVCIYFTKVEYYKKNCPFSLTEAISESLQKKMRII